MNWVNIIEKLFQGWAIFKWILPLKINIFWYFTWWQILLQKFHGQFVIVLILHLVMDIGQVHSLKNKILEYHRLQSQGQLSWYEHPGPKSNLCFYQPWNMAHYYPNTILEGVDFQMPTFKRTIFKNTYVF